MNIIEELLSLKIRHHGCEDTWYSCPKHPDGYANKGRGTECDCGADEHNDKVDAVIAELVLLQVKIHREERDAALRAFSDALEELGIEDELMRRSGMCLVGGMVV